MNINWFCLLILILPYLVIRIIHPLLEVTWVGPYPTPSLQNRTSVTAWTSRASNPQNHRDGWGRASDSRWSDPRMSPRTRTGDSRRKHSLLLHLICPAPGNEANTGKDRSEPRKKLLWWVHWSPELTHAGSQISSGFSTLWVNEFPCPCLSLSRFSFYLQPKESYVTHRSFHSA